MTLTCLTYLSKMSSYLHSSRRPQVNFKNFEEYSTYNWVPQRGEDNQDGTFLCSVVFEERDLRSLPSGRYKLLYFSAVHNHTVGYSDELEVSGLGHLTQIPVLWVRSFGVISVLASGGLFFVFFYNFTVWMYAARSLRTLGH